MTIPSLPAMLRVFKKIHAHVNENLYIMPIDLYFVTFTQATISVQHLTARRPFFSPMPLVISQGFLFVCVFVVTLQHVDINMPQ